eukprot:MONOS_1144.1-p1 / transcript=MONOS_1144.1 / gene=MONOS_1144 / organism=Monocercomonoides_exilis_PA203 / gene_product=unspecified product / transcript_product=unspecified product / location=Mono_scaffold00019:155321-156421(-) / protein_length=259 / sequence_SO=supercontig / SO=protein_coding / is_pseudo=false
MSSYLLLPQSEVTFSNALFYDDSINQITVDEKTTEKKWSYIVFVLGWIALILRRILSIAIFVIIINFQKTFRSGFSSYSGSVTLDTAEEMVRFTRGSNLFRKITCSKLPPRSVPLKDVIAIEPKVILRPPRSKVLISTKFTLSCEVPQLTSQRVCYISGNGFCSGEDFRKLKMKWLQWREQKYPEEAAARREEILLLSAGMYTTRDLQVKQVEYRSSASTSSNSSSSSSSSSSSDPYISSEIHSTLPPGSVARLSESS